MVVAQSPSTTFVYDAQICVRRTSPFERILLVRIFHREGEEELAELITQEDYHMTMDSSRTFSRAALEAQYPWSRDLREASALIKLIRAKQEVMNKELSTAWQYSPFPGTRRPVTSPKTARNGCRCYYPVRVH